MNRFSRRVALISGQESDHIVLEQAFADHPDRIALTCFKHRPDDLHGFGLVIGDGDRTVSGIPHLSLAGRPIRVGDLIDRTEAILLNTADRDDIIERGEYALDRRRMLLQIDGGGPVVLTERETEILSMLIEAGDKGCGREAMLDAIWGYRADLETHTLETHIYRLRQKIEGKPNDPRRLLTTDRGYILAAV